VALGFLVVSTVAIFAAFLFVLRRWSASATSYQFLLIPIPAIVLSALIDAEPLTPGLAVGGLLVLAGSWVGMRPGKGRSTAPQTKSATMISTSSRRMSRSRSSSRT
jgi:drug/metabolite transporter (DMT)-like permease